MKRLISLFLLICASLLWVVGCTPTATAEPKQTPVPTSSSLFDYDATVPFDVKITSEAERDGVTIVDLNYASHDPAFSPSLGGRTLVYLVKPQGEGPFAGIIYLHWLGPTKSNRGQYLDEAVALAQRGAVCLLLQGYVPWFTLPNGTEKDRPPIIGQVIELRRAVDFLLTQPGVDPNRLGFVGHDYGALYGGVLSGVDHRLKAYVLVAGVPSFADFGAFFGFPHDEYLSIIQDLDPIQHVSNAAPASIFFQFGERDSVVPKDLATEFYEAASEPKKIEWYDDLHVMSSDAVRQAREAWLAEQLDLNPLP